VVTIYADYTVTSDNYIILADCSVDNNAITITLPDVLLVDELELQFKKIELQFKKIDATAYSVTIDGFGSDLIDGQLTIVLYEQDASLTIVADADEPEWHIL
jgi:hypothetical protein